MFTTETPGTDTEIQLDLPFQAAVAIPDWRTQVPSVSQLTRRLRGHIENTFFDVWVKGEVSNFRKPISGHAYFILKDSTAQLRAVMFKGSLSKLKFDLKDGVEILLHGKISVYETRGEYQIVCDEAEPVGVGALQLAFEQLKAKLDKEGLFDPKFKKKLPTLPRRIGVVTSATGAAIRDILKVLHRRYPDRHILLFPAAVQGEKAAADIVNAIQLAQTWNAQNAHCALDVLIVGRGGGSIEDLWPFNEEIVARAIFQCSIPIISAVGHEIDFTIADFVADLRAPTPSAAAEIVVPRKEDLLYQLDNLNGRMRIALVKRIDQIRLHLSHLGQRLIDPREKARLLKEKVQTLQGKLMNAMKNRVALNRKQLERMAHVLNSLSPLQVIGRGYSITRGANGEIIRSSRTPRPGDKIFTQLSDGTIESTVAAPTPKNPSPQLTLPV